MLHTAGEGSATASLHELSPITMDCVPHDPRKNETVQLTTLDHFCRTNGIRRIDLLKVDVEGHKPMVLKGAKEMLTGRRIQFVQFEFGAFNLDSQTFLRDLFELLDGYRISRIVLGGLVEVPRYEPRLERFATMNYLAELR